MKWSFNNFKNWNTLIEFYTDLTKLDYARNKLIHLPEYIEPKLIILYYSFNNLTILPNYIGLWVNLIELDCARNKLTHLPESIGLCINLTKLDCAFNKLKHLPECFGLCVNLTKLNCSNNKLTRLPEGIGSKLKILQFERNNITALPNYIGSNSNEIWCKYNKLTSIPESIGPNLIDLFCDANNLTTLPKSIGLCVNLVSLYCSFNNLTTLPNSIGLCANLYSFNCDNNQLTTLPAELGNCKRLRFMVYYNNPIEFIPLNVQRLIGRMRNRQYIYGDRQNVHNHEIQQSIAKSIYSLLNDSLSLVLLEKNNTINNIINSSLSDKTKSALIEYSTDTSVHTVLNISFKELLDYVWQRINRHSDKENILRILEEEMSDAECKCFTGRMSRLVNCLNGFYDDICVGIGAKEQIGNIIVLIRDKLIVQGKYTAAAHKQQVRAALQERGYKDDEITVWLDYIE